MRQEGVLGEMRPRLSKDPRNVRIQQYYWDGVVDYFSNPWAVILLLYILYRYTPVDHTPIVGDSYIYADMLSVWHDVLG